MEVKRKHQYYFACAVALISVVISFALRDGGLLDNNGSVFKSLSLAWNYINIIPGVLTAVAGLVIFGPYDLDEAAIWPIFPALGFVQWFLIGYLLSKPILRRRRTA